MDWNKPYPILGKYENIIDNNLYHEKISNLLDELSSSYNFNTEDTFLIVKDILYKEFLKKKSNKK